MIRKMALLAALAFAAPAQALDGVSLEIGRGDERSEQLRGGLQWKWQRKWFNGDGWHVTGYWDASVGVWTADKSLVDFGLTPVFRMQRSDSAGFYAEAAIGFHLLSDLSVTRTRVFGSSFQFGDFIGAGWRLSERYDASLRILHLSNGGIRKPNPGINFLQLRLAYHFD